MGRQKIDTKPVATDALELMGHNVRTARINQRLTAQGLADRVHVSRRTISNIENGSPNTSIGTVFNVCAALGIPLFYNTPEELLLASRGAATRVALMPARVMPEDEPNDDF
ncbi:MAG: helix-turn-helix transcriptional regulator [Propionibacterium sp.]|nr:helix-turn-helix transcriptional regulator [Propionibacterium sp.]